VPLHFDDVVHHARQRHRPPVLRVELVAVDPSHGDRHSVEKEKPVPTLDMAETHPDGYRFDQAALAVHEGHDGVVQPGLLGRPRFHRRAPQPGAGRGAVQHCPPDDDRLVPVVQRQLDGRGGSPVPGCPVPRPFNRHRNDYFAGPGSRLVRSIDDDVGQMDGRAPPQGDIPEDPRQPPHVLVFQVAPVRPLVHLHSHDIAAGPGRGSDVELRGQAAALAVTDGLAVPKDVERAVDALEAQHYRPGLQPAGLELHLPAVTARRVLRRDPGRVDRERVGHVGVLRAAIAVQLPV